MLEMSQLAGILVTLFTAVISATDRKLLKRIRASGATTPETAVALPHSRWLARWRLQRLARRGVICHARQQAYYLTDPNRTKRRRSIRLRLLVIFVLGIVIGFIYLLSK